MDYEKKYKEALERAKKFEEKYGGGYAEYIFPELRESEDERIRMELKEAFEAYDIESKWNGIPVRSIIAWLEKQKEASKALEAVDRIDKYIDDHLANAHDMKDSNPDKKYYRGWDDALGEMARILQDVYSEEKQKDLTTENIYKHSRERMSFYNEQQKEQKPVSFSCGHENDKPAWSEEDEKMLDSIIKVVCGVGVQPNGLREKQVSFLEALRPQYHGDVTMTEAYKMGLEAGKVSSWKPSEEQMEALHTAMYLEEMQFYGGLKDKLRDLYVQLKKL